MPQELFFRRFKESQQSKPLGEFMVPTKRINEQMMINRLKKITSKKIKARKFARRISQTRLKFLEDSPILIKELDKS